MRTNPRDRFEIRAMKADEAPKSGTHNLYIGTIRDFYRKLGFKVHSRDYSGLFPEDRGLTSTHLSSLDIENGGIISKARRFQDAFRE